MGSALQRTDLREAGPVHQYRHHRLWEERLDRGGEELCGRVVCRAPPAGTPRTVERPESENLSCGRLRWAAGFGAVDRVTRMAHGRAKTGRW